MEPGILEIVGERLERLVEQRERFARKYGNQVAGFLDSLPGLFRLFHRLSFELDAPPHARRLAASVAVYIAEDHDFRGEGPMGVEGLLDDIWMSSTCLNQLATSVPPDVLRRHWLSPVPFEIVCELAQRVRVVEPHLPTRVMEQLRTFLV
jgi:hypothetical protein